MTCAKILTVILSVLPAMAVPAIGQCLHEAADVPASNPATAPASAPAPTKVKVGYLGVAVIGLDPAAAKQLGVAAGSGLRVTYVVPKSPADLAGLKTNDVLAKLDGQLVANLQQFTTLVRNAPPGRQIALKVFRGNQEMTLTAVLGQQEIPKPSDVIEARPAPGGMRPNSFHATTVNGKYLLAFAIEGGGKSLTVTEIKTGRVLFNGPINTKEDLDKVPPDALPLLPKLEKDCRALEALDRQVKLPPPKFVPTQVVYRDGKYNMTLRVDNGQKFLVAKDKADVTLYSGSVDAPQQVQGLPPEIQTRLKIMERSLQSVTGPPATQPGS